MIRNKLFFTVLALLIMDVIKTEDYDDYARRNRRRRPQQHQQYNSGPCGRFLGLSYINLNYNVDCSGGGHGSLGTLSDVQGGHGKPGTYNGGGLGNGFGHRPHKPHHQGAYEPNQGGLVNRPIWGALGNLASNFGTSGFLTNDLGSGSGGGLFDGSIINSFASLFSHNSEPAPASGSNNPQRPILTNRPPIAITTTASPANVNGPIVPIVDLRPVHEEYYDEDSIITIPL